MIIYGCKHGGFCFGVKRAVDKAKENASSDCYIIGDLIHNEKVCYNLSSSGLIKINSLNNTKFKENDKLIIRAHGESKKTFLDAEKLGLNVIDCTCPFVKRIQKIVEEHYLKGFSIAIIGDPNHAEIIGVNGWCDNKAFVCNSSEELNVIKAEKLCIVVQTTYSEKKYEEIIKKFDNRFVKTVDIFKTICYTTKERQNEAEKISKICDAVVVIGGNNSHNTKKLYEICYNNCKNVFLIDEAINFDCNQIINFNKVGIVLGASTPVEQFREVIQSMEKVTEEIINVETVEVNDETTNTAVESAEVSEVVKPVKTSKAKVEHKSEMQAAFDNIKPSKDFKIGQVVVASISSVNVDVLTISLKNTKKDFELPKDELLNENINDSYKVGDDIRVMVIGKNPVKFSEKAMEKVMKEEAEIEEIRNGKIFEANIISTNKGGLTGKYGSYEVFVPASQIRLGFVKELDKYIGKTLRLKAEKVESRGARRQIVGSQRVILEVEKQERDAIRAEKEKEFFDNVGVGDVVLGTPVRFASFGAFVEVNGFDCLAHISDLSWTGCKSCSDVLEIGKQYEFKVLKIEEETKRVSIGYKQLQPKPWDSVMDKYKVGDVIKGKVVRIVSFGAFVEVEKGIDGLVHVSQISNEWLENPVTALEVGQEIDAKILDINPEKEKMTLSIKALLPEPVKPEVVEEKEDTKGKRGKKKDEEPVEEELHEWKDADNGDISIAEMLNNNENK